MHTNDYRSARATLAAAIISLALPGLTLPVWAANELDDKTCSNATLKGDYGLHATGIRPAVPPAGIGQPEHHATLAIRSYDGKGTFTGTGIVSNGQISGVSQNTSTSGTYEVNADCSGIVTISIPGLPVQIRSAFVIVDRGREIKEVPLSPGSVGVAILRKK